MRDPAEDERERERERAREVAHGASGAGMRRCTAAELDEPDSAWNLAAARTWQADPFCCRTEWQLAFHEAFAPRRPLHLVADGGSVLAFAERRIPAIGTLLEPVECDWLFGCPLLGEGAVELLARWLAARQPDGGAPWIVLSGIVPGGALQQRLFATFGRRWLWKRLEPAVLCSASLDGGLDGYLARRSGKHRRGVAQAARRASARGVTFERHVPRSAAEAAAVYERMLAVERASWKGIGRCGMAEPPSRAFYGAMLRRLAASGRGRVMFARAVGAGRDGGGIGDVGFVFGGLAGAVYRGQQFSYVESWSDASIGNLLQLEQLRWLVEEGVQRYDMGPRMDYKRHWTEIETTIEAWLLRAV